MTDKVLVHVNVSHIYVCRLFQSGYEHRCEQCDVYIPMHFNPLIYRPTREPIENRIY